MLFRNRNYLLYILGLATSLFGTYTYNFAIGLYVLNQTGSAQSFATTLIIGILPVILFGPLSGSIVDRCNKQHIIIFTDLLSGLLFLCLFFIFKAGQLSLQLIYITTFIISILSTLFNNSMMATKTLIFSKEDYESVNASSQVISSAATICAPITGGLIYGFVDIGTFIFINGMSFILSALIESFLKFPEHKHNKALVEHSAIDNMKDGFMYVKKRKHLHIYILYFLVLNFILGFAVSIPVPYIITRILSKPAELYGSIEASFPFGLIIGGLTITKLSRRLSFERILMLVLRTLVILLALIGLLAYMPFIYHNNGLLLAYLSCIHLIFGMVIAYVDVPIITLLQQKVDQAYIGRVMGLVMAMVKSIYPVGLALSGILCNKISPYALPIIGAFLILCFQFYITNFFMMSDKLAEMR